MGNILPKERIYSPYCETMDSLYNKNYFSDRELKIEEIKNGVILPTRRIKGNNKDKAEGGVCDEKLNFVAGLLPNWCARAYPVPEEEIQFVDETVVYGGMLWEHPGHLLRDALESRLWWVVKNPDSNIRIAINRIGGVSNCQGAIQEALELLDISTDRVFWIEHPTRFRSVIVPDQSTYVLRDYTAEYISVVDKMKSNVAPGPYEKVYFTKTNTLKDDFVGEEYFIEFFRKKGYEIINPEEYSLKEKISILKGAKEFAAINGTNTVYAVCCNSDVKLIILERVDKSINCQSIICQARGIKDFYSVDVCLSFLSQGFVVGSKLVGITKEWKEFVRNYYGEEIGETTNDYLREHVYDYLVNFTEKCENPLYFEQFKEFDHFSILNTLNRLIHGNDLDSDSYMQETLGQYRLQIKALKDQLSQIAAATSVQIEVFEKILLNALNKIEMLFPYDADCCKNLRKYLIKPRFFVSTRSKGGKWSRQVNDEEISGVENSKAPITSIKIESCMEGKHIYYSVFRKEGIGWSVDISDGNVCGSIKKSVPINALKMRLDDELSEYFTIEYRAFTHPKGWTAWVADGKATPWSDCDMIDAIQMRIAYREDFAEKWKVFANTFLENIENSLKKGKDELLQTESEKYKAQIEELQNKIQAQEYIINSLQDLLTAIVNNRKNEDNG